MGNNKSTNWGRALAGLVGVIGVASILDELFSTKSDTVNYKLKSRTRVVYHGICYEDRLDDRIYEHECSGKTFDEVIYDNPKPRKKAITIERKRILRDKPKYNIHHNN